MKKRTCVVLLSMMLVLGVSVGAVLAWLTDKTDPVENVFTIGDVEIELTESEELDLRMIPGHFIFKDPKVTVKADTEKCFVFVKIDETDWPMFMEEDEVTRKVDYKIADGWTELENASSEGSKVYYRVVDAVADGTAEDQLPVFEVLKQNQVTVSENMTKEEMDEITKTPTLTFTAYACQYMKNNETAFDAAEAWATVAEE